MGVKIFTIPLIAILKRSITYGSTLQDQHLERLMASPRRQALFPATTPLDMGFRRGSPAPEGCVKVVENHAFHG